MYGKYLKAANGGTKVGMVVIIMDTNTIVTSTTTMIDDRTILKEEMVVVYEAMEV